MSGFFIAFLIALAVAHSANMSSSSPDVSTEFVGDARLAVEAAAKDAGKRFVDESNTAQRVLLRFDAGSPSIQSLDNRLQFIARQLPSGWVVVVRNNEVILRGGSREQQ